MNPSTQIHVYIIPFLACMRSEMKLSTIVIFKFSGLGEKRFRYLCDLRGCPLTGKVFVRAENNIIRQ